MSNINYLILNFKPDTLHSQIYLLGRYNTIKTFNKNFHSTNTNNMSYFNYHAKIKNLIKSGDCLSVSLLYKYNKIKPAMVFYFKSHIPMPVRDYMWQDYFPLIRQYNLKLDNPDNLYYEE